MTRRSHAAAAQLRVRSAINPMLWLCAIVTPSSFGTAYLFSDNPLYQGILLSVGTLPVLVASIGFLYFMIRSPEKLQSEEYQLRHEAMELIRQKGVAFPISPTSLNALTNPMLPQVAQEGHGK